jgi:hypothetical protein
MLGSAVIYFSILDLKETHNFFFTQPATFVAWSAGISTIMCAIAVRRFSLFVLTVSAFKVAAFTCPPPSSHNPFIIINATKQFKHKHHHHNHIHTSMCVCV